MKPLNIAIFSIVDDIHALVIQQALHRKYHDVNCFVIESNNLSNKAALNWSNVVSQQAETTVTDRNGDEISIEDLDLIWWRRAYHQQELPESITDPAHAELIHNDCSAALLGLLLNDFTGVWVSHPTATRLAENKLIQLKAAQKFGIKVPETLVSQNPEKIRQFCAERDHQVIVKPVKGIQSLPLYTSRVTEAHLASDEGLMLCPAIYQECIPGHQHLRVQCFGDTVVAVLMESERLDWRQNLDIPFQVVQLEENLQQRLRAVLQHLGLKMGIFDLKLNLQGEPVWIELNPQGQFLFVEGLSGLDLTSIAASFLYQETKRHRATENLVEPINLTRR